MTFSLWFSFSMALYKSFFSTSLSIMCREERQSCHDKDYGKSHYGKGERIGFQMMTNWILIKNEHLLFYAEDRKRQQWWSGLHYYIVIVSFFFTGKYDKINSK